MTKTDFSTRGERQRDIEKLLNIEIAALKQSLADKVKTEGNRGALGEREVKWLIEKYDILISEHGLHKAPIYKIIDDFVNWCKSYSKSKE